MAEPEGDVRAYLRSVHRRTHTLDPAPDPTGPGAGEAMAARVEDWHTCDRCGALACVAYVARTTRQHPWHWLDLCAEDASWLVAGATMLNEGKTDD